MPCSPLDKNTSALTTGCLLEITPITTLWWFTTTSWTIMTKRFTGSRSTWCGILTQMDITQTTKPRPLCMRTWSPSPDHRKPEHWRMLFTLDIFWTELWFCQSLLATDVQHVQRWRKGRVAQPMFTIVSETWTKSLMESTGSMFSCRIQWFQIPSRNPFHLWFCLPNQLLSQKTVNLSFQNVMGPIHPTVLYLLHLMQLPTQWRLKLSKPGWKPSPNTQCWDSNISMETLWIWTVSLTSRENLLKVSLSAGKSIRDEGIKPNCEIPGWTQGWTQDLGGGSGGTWKRPFFSFGKANTQIRKFLACA